MWVITLLVLALAAFLIVKAAKAHSERKAADEARKIQGSGLTGQLDHQSMATNAPNAPDDSAGSDQAEMAGTNRATASASSAFAPTATATTTPVAGSSSDAGVSSGDHLHDIREMIKILNLAEADAGRLDISREQFAILRGTRQSDEASLPPSDKLTEVADRLRHMLA